MLPKENRLSKNKFQGLGKQGKKYRGEYGMFVLEKQSELNPRFGFIVSKKIGNAVQRHRMTRLLREIVKKHFKDIPNIAGVYIAFKYCDNYEKLEKDFVPNFNDALRDLKKD